MEHSESPETIDLLQQIRRIAVYTAYVVELTLGNIGVWSCVPLLRVRVH